MNDKKRAQNALSQQESHLVKQLRKQSWGYHIKNSVRMRPLSVGGKIEFDRTESTR